jgi:hypothetical protein
MCANRQLLLELQEFKLDKLRPLSLTSVVEKFQLLLVERRAAIITEFPSITIFLKTTSPCHSQYSQFQ